MTHGAATAWQRRGPAQVHSGSVVGGGRAGRRLSILRTLPLVAACPAPLLPRRSGALNFVNLFVPRGAPAAATHRHTDTHTHIHSVAPTRRDTSLDVCV